MQHSADFATCYFLGVPNPGIVFVGQIWFKYYGQSEVSCNNPDKSRIRLWKLIILDMLDNVD